MANGYYITLVHGTFAKNAPWTRRKSVFSEKLEKELDCEILFDQFNWSGKNSYKGRVKAGSDLELQLAKKIEEFPYHKHVVVGHSHGGNVIFYALKNNEHLCSRIRVITLATPFLISQLSEDENTLRMLELLNGTLVPYALAFIVAGLTWVVQFNLAVTYGPKFEFLYILGLTGIITATYVFPLIVNVYKIISNKLNKDDLIVEYVFNEIDITPKVDVALLSIIAKRDEARQWLKISSFLTLTVRKSFDLLNKYLVKLNWLILCIFIYPILFIIPYYLLAGFFSWDTRTVDKWSEFLYVKIGLYTIIFYFFYFKCFSWIKRIFIVFCANPLFYGWKPWKHYLFIKTTASAYPSHVKNPQYRELVIKKGNIFKLRHSVIYEKSEVVTEMAKWLTNSTPPS